MNSFNKLYNLILQSIISQNKASRKAMLQKAGWNQIGVDAISEFLDKFDNKTADFICKYIADGTLKEQKDERIKQVSRIIELNPSIDTQSFKGTLDQFIQKYKETVAKYQQKAAAKDVQSLDKIPQFYDKQNYAQGVVVYKVRNTRDGMNAVRKVIDNQWGYDANPWCLAARKDGELKDAWTMWNAYNGYPKQIAFQNGKLLAFRANDKGEKDYWWDRNDHPSTSLCLSDKTKINITVPKWTKEEIQYKEQHKLEIFIDRYDLVLNEETNRYDGDAYDIKVDSTDLINGHLPIKFGEVTGSFTIIGGKDLIDLEGMPTRIGRDLRITRNNLKSLKGCPREINGLFMLHHCDSLVNLQGGPRRVEGDMLINECRGLQSLKGGPRAVCKTFTIQLCPKLNDAEGLPQYIGQMIKTYGMTYEFIHSDAFIAAKQLEQERLEQRFVEQYDLTWNEQTGRYDCHDQWGMHISNCENYYINKEGTFIVPLGEIDGSFTLSQFDQLKSLKNGPTKVKGRIFELVGCHYLMSLQGCPEQVDGVFRLVNNHRLTSLKGITQKIGERLEIGNNGSLRDSSDLPTNIKQLCVDNKMPAEFFESQAYKTLEKAGKVLKASK